jgi:hypothetical protein
MADLPWLEPFAFYGTTASNMLRAYNGLTGSPTLNPTGGPGSRPALAMNSGNVLTKTFSASYARWIIGARIKISTLAAVQLFRLEDGGSNQIELSVNADGTLKTTRNGTLLSTASAAAISAGSFYYVEWDATIANSGSFEIRLNEGVIRTASGVDTQATANASANQFLLAPSGTGVTYCDLVIQAGAAGGGATYWGDVKLEYDTSVSDDTPSQWPPSTGTDKYSVVDDAATDASMTDYISSATPGDRQTFVFGGLATGAGSVKAVRMIALTDKDDPGTTRQIELYTRVGSTNYDSGTTETLNYGDAQYVGHTWETNPATAVAWTLSEASNFKGGVELVA